MNLLDIIASQDAIDFFGSLFKTSGKELSENWRNKPDWKKSVQKYREKLLKLYGTIHMYAMSEAIPLDQLYIPVNILNQPTALGRGSTRESLEKMFVEGTSSEKNTGKEEEGMSLLKKYNRLFILGKPGSGKTTFLKYVCMQPLAGEIERLPIFIALRDVVQTGLSLKEYCYREFEICDFPEAKPFVEKILKDGKALVLFDGLDEIPRGEKQRSRVVREIHDFEQQYDQSQILLTCRIAAEEYHFEGFTYVEIADFDEEQVKAFVNHWFEKKEDVAKSFLYKLNQQSSQNLKELFRSPLLLTLLCVDFENTLKFPLQLSEIYENALETLLNTWDARRGITRDEIYQSLSTKRKHQLFSEIAASSFQNKQVFFEEKSLVRQIEKFIAKLPQSGTMEPDGMQVLKSMESQHGILVEREYKIYSFSHLSIQQYYTARYFAEHQGEESIINLISIYFEDSLRREIFFLSAEILDDIDAFLELLFTQMQRILGKEEKHLNWIRKWVKKQEGLNSESPSNIIKTRSKLIANFKQSQNSSLSESQLNFLEKFSYAINLFLDCLSIAKTPHQKEWKERFYYFLEVKKKVKTKSIYFTSLSVANVKCFGEKQTIHFLNEEGKPAHWTVILGNNNMGKTTILRALAGVEPLNGESEPPEIRFQEFKKEFPWLVKRDQCKENAVIQAEFQVSKKLKNIPNETFSLRAEISQNMSQFQVAKKEKEKSDVDFFLLGYGVNRKLGDKLFVMKKQQHTWLTKGLFDSNVDLIDPQQWLLSMDYSSRLESPVQEREKWKLTTVISILKEIFPDISDIRFLHPDHQSYTPELQFLTPFGWATVVELSAGYQTMLAWIADLTYRIFDHYPDSSNPIEEPAIVLVDEIDLHMHPRWQREIMDFLGKRFINTQFIVTAHSPLIAQAAGKRNLIVLRQAENQVLIENNPVEVQGWRIDQILNSDLYQVPNRSVEYERLLQERKRLLSQSHISMEDREKIRELEEQMGPIPTAETQEDIQAMELIRKTAAILRKEEEGKK